MDGRAAVCAGMKGAARGQVKSSFSAPCLSAADNGGLAKPSPLRE
jgi:hypothetical protein